MPPPVGLRNSVAQMMSDAWDAWLSGQAFNGVGHFLVAGERVKVHVQAGDPDHAKGVYIRVVWRRRKDDPPVIE